jgi:hypothetical protein
VKKKCPFHELSPEKLHTTNICNLTDHILTDQKTYKLQHTQNLKIAKHYRLKKIEKKLAIFKIEGSINKIIQGVQKCTRFHLDVYFPCNSLTVRNTTSSTQVILNCFILFLEEGCLWICK